MAILEHGREVPAIVLPRLRRMQILSISIFWLALNFHWSALGTIILPSQVYKIVGNADKGVALAAVLVPGAFVSLFANPLFGLLSDRMRGRLAVWGRRRPFILAGTLLNVVALVAMAASRDIPSLTISYVLVQFSSNAAQAPFHALLPDIVPEEQRGLASGVMALLAIVGSITGVLVAGLFVDSSMPLPQYYQGLWLTYSIIITVLLALMVVTIITVRERFVQSSLDTTTQEAGIVNKEATWEPAIAAHRSWFARIRRMFSRVRERLADAINRAPARSQLLNVCGTVIAAGVVWGLMTAWNRMFSGAQISGDIQQVVLEVIATLGILRMFDFNPRRDPDFAWVLLTRLVMMLGIFTIQAFLQYYMRDALGVRDPERQTTNFVIIVSLTALASAVAAGWLSDRFGRKRMVYLAGGFMALVGLVFVISPHSLLIVLAAGAVFGIGFGAYQSVDWALVADVLPSEKNLARDMGVWNISLSLPQVIAPVVGGPIIDHFTRTGSPITGYQVIFIMAIIYCLIGTVTVRFIKGVKR